MECSVDVELMQEDGKNTGEENRGSGDSPIMICRLLF